MGEAFRASGYRKAVHVSGYLREVEAHRLRLKGFREGFGEEVPLIETPVGIEGGMAAARIIAPEVRAGRIDSVCGVNDLTALGILKGLGECNVRVPEECLVAGYDNLPVDLGLTCKVPSVDLRLGLLYRLAVQGLVDFIIRGQPLDRRLAPLLVPGALLDLAESSP